MSEKLSVSIVIPSKGGVYFEYTLKSLANQTNKPDEVILVLKDCDVKKIENICEKFKLPCIIEEQKKGFFTDAMNIGKNLASGEIVIFTDDDVILFNNWIQKYVELFRNYPENIGSISSRDIYYDLKMKKTRKTPDDFLHVKIYRWFIRPFIEPPHFSLKKYKLGSYISKNYRFVFGRGIPNRTCFSLPFRGVNMAFRKEAIEEISFLSHPDLKRGFRCEQHFGLRMILNGYDSVYVPNNPVYHIIRESLSRPNKKEELEQLKREEEIVRQEIIKMLEGNK